MNKLREALIVGVDPGSTLGLCVIDISGKIQGIFSFKSPKAHDVVNQILAFGIPVIVSCDKKKPPEYANKLSARLGCRVISPSRDLLVSEKKRLVMKNDCLALVSNSHQRDACASAYYAFSRLKNSIKKIEDSFTQIEGNSAHGELDGLLFKKILVEAKTVNEIKEGLEKEKTNKTQNTNRKSFANKSPLKKNAKARSELALPNKWSTKIYLLKEEIARLKGENEKISLRVKELESEIDIKAKAQANEKLKKIASEKRLLSRINLQVSDTNSKLKEKLEELNKQIAKLKERLNNDDFEMAIIFSKGSKIKLNEIDILKNRLCPK